MDTGFKYLGVLSMTQAIKHQQEEEKQYSVQFTINKSSFFPLHQPMNCTEK